MRIKPLYPGVVIMLFLLALSGSVLRRSVLTEPDRLA